MDRPSFALITERTARRMLLICAVHVTDGRVDLKQSSLIYFIIIHIHFILLVKIIKNPMPIVCTCTNENKLYFLKVLFPQASGLFLIVIVT